MAYLLQGLLALFLMIFLFGIVYQIRLVTSFSNTLGICEKTTALQRINFFKLLGLCSSIVAFFFGLYICFMFNKNFFEFQGCSGFYLATEYELGFFLGLDGISVCFLVLTLFIFPLCFLAAWPIKKNPIALVIYLVSIELLLILTFISTDLLLFYICFESILIPMFLIIGEWGSRSRKNKAAYYFFLYTLFGSLFMLFGIFYLYLITRSTNFTVILNTQYTFIQQVILFICFFMAFSAKIPMFPFHIWLPEAHVEAPTIGSVLLASLLLKLGGYGFLRFLLPMFPAASKFFGPLLSVLCVLSIVYASLTTLRQIDMKRIIAYSSIAHMNVIVLGLFSNTQQGLEGAIYLMIAHGVVSSALFFCVGVLYDKYHTRLLKYYGGLTQTMPLFAVLFFIFSLANMSFPGTSNFIGELLILTGVLQSNFVVMVFASSGIILSAAYSIWLFNRVAFGTLKLKYLKNFKDITLLDFMVLWPLVVFMIILGLNSNIILDFIALPVAQIILKTF